MLHIPPGKIKFLVMRLYLDVEQVMRKFNIDNRIYVFFFFFFLSFNILPPKSERDI